MLIFVIVVLGLSLLILGHEAGHFFAAKAFGLKVDEFGFGFPPRIAAWKKGDTEYSLNWLPFGGFVKISGERGEFAAMDEKVAEQKHEAPADPQRLFYTQPAWKKSVIILAGIFMNFILGWLLISAVLMIGVPKALVITGTQPNSPAATAGFQSGDVVKDYRTAQDFVNYIDAHEGQDITVAILRNNKEIDFKVTPRTNAGPDQGPIGVLLAEGGTERENPFAALRDGLIDTGSISLLTLGAFRDLIVQLFAHASLLQGVVGPVGIVGIAEETGRIGLTYLLQFLGLISVNLMVVNLIPFPALDGGRFLMIIIEKIKGSSIPLKVEMAINGIGFAFLILLMLLLTVRDVRGLF